MELLVFFLIDDSFVIYLNKGFTRILRVARPSERLRNVIMMSHNL